MRVRKWLSFAESKRRGEKAEVRKTAKPLTRKEVEKQIRSGKLTEEQAIELRQRYMDSLEYNDMPQQDCGDIQPLPSLLPTDEEE